MQTHHQLEKLRGLEDRSDMPSSRGERTFWDPKEE